jgi:hypothetical protein
MGSGLSWIHSIGISLEGLGKTKSTIGKGIVYVQIRTPHLQNARQRRHYQNQICPVGRCIISLNRQKTTYVWRNMGRGSRYECFSGKTKSITNSECEFLAWGNQHAMRMCHVAICGLPSYRYFFTLSHKRHVFRKPRYWTQNKFSPYQLCLKHFSFKKVWSENMCGCVCMCVYIYKYCTWIPIYI